MGEAQEAMPAALGHVVGLHVRRGAAKDGHRSGDPGEFQGNRAGVIQGVPFLLFEGGLVFLVDDDQAN